MFDDASPAPEIDESEIIPIIASGQKIDFNAILLDQNGNNYKADCSLIAILKYENSTIAQNISLN